MAPTSETVIAQASWLHWRFVAPTFVIFVVTQFTSPARRGFLSSITETRTPSCSYVVVRSRCPGGLGTTDGSADGSFVGSSVGCPEGSTDLGSVPAVGGEVLVGDEAVSVGMLRRPPEGSTAPHPATATARNMATRPWLNCSSDVLLTAL
jgi:hypothetical protein